MKSFYSLICSTLCAFLFLNGCSVLVGQVKPVEEKSTTTKVPDLSLTHPEWKKIILAATFTTSEDSPDAAWQSQTTAAVISINSACGQKDDERTDPKHVTAGLLSQWNKLKVISQVDLKISGYPAVETLAEGFYLGRTRKFQTDVVKTSSCVYDLIYLSPSTTFEQERSVFQQFRDSLMLK